MMTENNVNPRSRSLVSTSLSTLTRASHQVSTRTRAIQRDQEKRPSTDHDEESVSAREDGSVKVKVKVIVEPPNQANVAEFNQEFQDIYLDREMSKANAAKELDEIKQAFTEFMERYHKDPKKAHKDLTDCELRSLAHVNPDKNIEEDEFYFEHASEHPTMEEFRAAHNPSGYPLRLPVGLKKLKNHHDPEVIKSFTTGILDARN